MLSLPERTMALLPVSSHPLLHLFPQSSLSVCVQPPSPSPMFNLSFQCMTKILHPVCYVVVVVDGGGVETVLLRPSNSFFSHALSLPLRPLFKAHSHTKTWSILYFHLFFYESLMVCVWGQKICSFSFRDPIGRLV